MALNSRSASLAQLIQEGENDKQQGGGVPRAANIQAPGITRAPKGGGDPIGLANQVSEFTTGKSLGGHFGENFLPKVEPSGGPTDVPGGSQPLSGKALSDVFKSPDITGSATGSATEAVTGAASSLGSEAATSAGSEITSSAGSEIASGTQDLIGGFFA